MLVSTKGRYALRVLVDLAERHEEGVYVPLKQIAERQGLSEKYLESVLKSLVKHDVLLGARGKGGGYRLGVEPDELTVGRVLRLTEPTLGTVSCLTEGNSGCGRCDKCPTVSMWRELDNLILDFLDSHTVADLVATGDDGLCGTDQHDDAY